MRFLNSTTKLSDNYKEHKEVDKPRKLLRMDEMMSSEIIANVVTALVGALIGFFAALIVMLYQFRETKRQLCIDMYQEFDSLDMIQSRFEASELLSEARKTSSSILLEELYDNPKTRSQYMHLARVLRFWERLSVMVISGRIDRELAQDIFSYDYKNWRDDYMSHCKSDRYESLNRIRRLDHYLAR